MQNSILDNLVVLKDAPMFWRKPSYLRTMGDLGEVSIEIFYSLMFGQEYPPTKVQPFLTRGSIKTTSKKESYFAAVFVPNRQISGFSYPPVGTNQIDPAALFNASLKKVRYISTSLYEMPLSDFKPLAPKDVVDNLLLRGGTWT